MELTFLGTSSGTPTRQRNVSGSALRFDDGAIWIVDCGEGTQHRLLETSLRPGRVEAILLTHLHGDHCYGLPGLLASLAVHDRHEPVVIVGPHGVKEWISVTARMSDLKLGYRWRVVEFTEPGALDIGLDRLAVEVLPLVHRVPSYAYRLTEPARRGRFENSRAAALGIPDGPLRGRLAKGEVVTLPDGRKVDPSEVIGGDRPGRCVVLCGDSADSSALIGKAEGCDLLVHECTYETGREEQARQWGHSTAGQVGDLAAQLQPRHLVLTHLSSRYTVSNPDMNPEDLGDQCRQRCPAVTVTMADDLMTIPIPARER